MRLCVDCRWIVLHNKDQEMSHCDHPTSAYQSEESPVTGRLPQPMRTSCWAARKSYPTGGGKCGPEGKFFQPAHGFV
jgi:hypothetical protein